MEEQTDIQPALAHENGARMEMGRAKVSLSSKALPRTKSKSF